MVGFGTGGGTAAAAAGRGAPQGTKEATGGPGAPPNATQPAQYYTDLSQSSGYLVVNSK